MSVGSPLEGPKDEKLHEPPKGEGATPEANNPRTNNLPPHLGG